MIGEEWYSDDNTRNRDYAWHQVGGEFAPNGEQVYSWWQIEKNRKAAGLLFAASKVSVSFHE